MEGEERKKESKGGLRTENGSKREEKRGKEMEGEEKILKESKRTEKGRKRERRT